MVRAGHMLTEQELAFLKQQGLGPEDVLDGRFLSQEARRKKAKVAGKEIVIGSACSKGGHRLRTRYGHCVQCDTSKIAFLKRYNTKAYVYIAGSKEKKFIKIGQTNEISDREKTLNFSSGDNEAYARANDWCILLHFHTDESGRIEQETKQVLENFSSPQPYIRGGKQKNADEIYTCSFKQAEEALKKVLESKSIKTDKLWKSKNTDEY